MLVRQLEQPQRQPVAAVRLARHVAAPLEHREHAEQLGRGAREALRDRRLREPAARAGEQLEDVEPFLERRRGVGDRRAVFGDRRRDRRRRLPPA